MITILWNHPLEMWKKKIHHGNLTSSASWDFSLSSSRGLRDSRNPSANLCLVLGTAKKSYDDGDDGNHHPNVEEEEAICCIYILESPSPQVT